MTNPDLLAVVKPGEVLALGYSRMLSDVEVDRIRAEMQPFRGMGIRVVILDGGVNRMIVAQLADDPVVDKPVDSPVDNRLGFL